jgi:uncharacterized membrane protein YqjE
MSAEELNLWKVTLMIGLIVILAVIGLLSLLVSFVRSIDREVDMLWTDTKMLATNTTGMYQLAGTASIVRALREELLRHEKFLGRIGR